MTPRSSPLPSAPASSPAVPRLEAGDRLTRAEFERRYDAMPGLKKGELIEGVVYLPSPLRIEEHGDPTRFVSTWLGTYQAVTPGVQGADNATVRLDDWNEPQPDNLLRIRPEGGGRSRTGPEGYVEGPPELIVEVASSSVSYDLHQKLEVYRRHGVLEYVVWRVLDGAVDWFQLEGGQYRPLEPDASGILKSRVFPGLWLDPQALLRGELARVLDVARDGARSPEHAAFAARLAEVRRE